MFSDDNFRTFAFLGKLTKLMDISDQYLTNPKQAHCEPQLEPVDLGLVNTYDVSYYPTCVRVKRCGGCCPQKDIFSCQPTASKKQIVKVSHSITLFAVDLSLIILQKLYFQFNKCICFNKKRKGD